MQLIGLYVGNMRERHAAVRMEEVRAHLELDALRLDRRHR